MIAELSARQVLPHAVVDNVAARTGGVPLFVEETADAYPTDHDSYLVRHNGNEISRLSGPR
jgi:hypothetical protein